MQTQRQTRGTGPIALGVLAAAALVVVAGIALTQAAMPDTMMWDWHYGMWNDGHMGGWGVWGWGMLFAGLLWTAVVVGGPLLLVYWLVTRSQSTGHPKDQALEVLREQYARGDIDDEEYERRRERLTSER